MPLSHKAAGSIYDEISGYYESANSFLTLGLDKYWRKRAARIISGRCPGISKVLDICCGTGDFTRELSIVLGKSPEISACDINEKMLQKAEMRLPGVSFSRADCARLPYKNEEFDLVTVSFAARNIFLNDSDYAAVSREILRVLKKDGTFAILETTVPDNRLMANLMFFFVSILVEILVFFKPKSRRSYYFLKNTIMSFKTAKQLSGIMLEAGFSKAEYKILCPGAAAVHLCSK